MRWTYFVLSLFMILNLAGCATSSSGKGPRVEGERLSFALPDLAGKRVSSNGEQFRGKVVLVTLWGTWCPPCVSEIPTFNDLQDRFGDEGLEIVAIAFEKEPDPTVRRNQLLGFTSEHDINYLVLDGGTTGDFSTALPMVVDVEGLPVEILIGRDGLVVDARNGYGYSEKWAQGLENRVKEMLEE